MEDIRTRPLSSIEGPSWRRMMPQVLVLIYLLIGMITYVAVPFLALSWFQVPFIGAFVEQTMVFNGTGPTSDPVAWSAYNQGLMTSSQLVSINGQPVRNSQQMKSVLENYKPGDEVTLQARTLDGKVTDYSVRLSRFPFKEQFNYFYIPYLIGLVYLASAVWVFAIRRNHASGRAFAQFTVSIALGIGLIYDLYTTHMLSWLWTIAIAMIGGSAIELILLFPREDPAVQRRPILASIGIILAFPLAVYALIRLYDYNHPTAYILAWQLVYAFIGLSFLFILFWAFARYRRITWPNDREQIRLIAYAALISFLPIALWLMGVRILEGFHISWPFQPYLLLPLAVFPVMAGYTVQRYRLIQTDIILSLGVRYGLMSVLITVGYALMASGLGLLLARWIAPDSPMLTGFIFFCLALLLIWFRERSQRMVDAMFFRGRRAFQDRLQTFSGELTRVVDLPGILSVLRRYVEESLVPSRLHIYVFDPLSDQYVASPDASGQPTSDLRFPIISGLAIRLSEQRSPLLLNEYDALPPTLEPDRPRLILLGAQAFVPLPGRQRLSGWLALGPRPSGEPYTSMQLSFAEALCDQAALAIERAQVVGNMENRVRAMNVLTRVAQGINITLSLDDILELVYAQTTQIIPAQHFHIMLYDKDVDIYQYPFYLEGDDRVSENEERFIPAGHALEQEVIRQRRSILTDDFNRECQKRGILAARTGVYAWMGVPLNAGAETIGALSLGCTDPTVEYTAEQESLLQAIADQVAGALVKARLLQETERRARQLTSLNDVTRQLTSTLETEPLLQSILQSAVEILNCQAGSLLLVDETNDELVFRSVVSPVASDLMGKRMPADRGVAGKSMKTGEPIIVNDVSRFPEWFSKPDKDTGFSTHGLLVIPLKIKDRVIGVIEVINKKDGSIFSKEDQELLSTFAPQAAVAIDNARLYTMTDQALAARVEELSVMQRIDRELNASLETSAAMSITLDWAMRQSGAEAGLVCVLQNDDTSGVRVMASQGYGKELEPFQSDLLPVADYKLQDAIEGGLPIRRSLNGKGDLQALLLDGRSQAIIPIRRETGTIGLLLLESTLETQLPDESMNFLIRLSDHASIAISNAQLYAAVQQANLAKSDFVSFVAHELKNPMTSVKGYTELISSGAVGPITDFQANFLGTIRANIERMNTLVSDLNDMSKIEVGRLRLDFKPLRLSDSIEVVVRSTKKQVEEKQQVLNLNIPADLPMIWADKTRLEQVLVNLVSNAHKYTPPGGVLEVAAEGCPNQWDPNGAAEVVHIWVKDNGIGINEEDQKKIFQKFFRSDDPKTREVTGTGLGLNITKSLVEMQGGRIWFDSEFRRGTTFHFTVPVSET
jgi:signal transduction histidine kinase/putative methionine-R-sulfoxide reductase with GAF domain